MFPFDLSCNDFIEKKKSDVLNHIKTMYRAIVQKMQCNMEHAVIFDLQRLNKLDKQRFMGTFYGIILR